MSILDNLTKLVHRNAYDSWILFLVVFIFIFLSLLFIKTWSLRKLKKHDLKNDKIHLHNIFVKTKVFFIFVIALAVASQLLSLPINVNFFLNKLTFFVSFFQIGIWSNYLICLTLGKCSIKTNHNKTSTLLLSILLKTLLWSIIFLLALSNLGINVTALIGGLGIGGIAVALAVQNILGDLLASLSIVIDKPFEDGDFIVINEHMGTVEKTGLKTTRLKSLSGEQLIFSNSDLLKSVIKNYKRMKERRVVLNIDLLYETPVNKLEKIPSLIRKIIDSQKILKFDRAHFNGFKASSLGFEIVYWVLDPDYNIFMDAQQLVNLEIFKTFKAEEIEFAYPTQKIFLNK